MEIAEARKMIQAHLEDDYRAMIAADKDQLKRALENGERVNAHGCVDAIIDTQQELEDFLAR